MAYIRIFRNAERPAGAQKIRKTFDKAAYMSYNSMEHILRASPAASTVGSPRFTERRSIIKMSDKYTIGVDFGTLSGRALLVRVRDGHEMADAVMDYPHGVIDRTLPETGEQLPPDWALEDPHDFPLVLEHIIPEVIARAGVDKRDVIGIGIDFTCCSVMPIYADGTPLCFTDKYKGNKHAYLKLWKHHAANKYAERMTEVAARRGEKWLRAFGGKVSSEWMFPKIWQLYAEAPDIYRECDMIVEAGDWMTWLLCGVMTHGYLYAAYKSHYMIHDGGFPSPDFFAELDPGLRDVVKEKVSAPVAMPGVCVGRVTPEAAERFGLAAGTAVSSASPDAHIAAPAVGFEKCGEMYGVLGTSNCYYALSKEFKDVPGICGCAWDGLAEGLYGYEAGLCCGGDHFSWLANNFTPAEYKAEAERLGIPPIKYIISKAAAKRPGETGLVALDWWNGNRSVLVDVDLSGLIIGMNLQTRVEDIMRALIEATAFGTRVIIENFRAHGIDVNYFYAAGGIARKDPFTMQLYSDVLQLPIRIAGSSLMPCLGTAILAAVAAGTDAGSYATIHDASMAMRSLSDTVYTPDPEAGAVYDRLYAEYLALHDYFGRGGSNVMKRLRAIAADARE